MTNERQGRRRVALAAALLSVGLGTGCEVTNPGPVQDEFLTLPAAQEGFVNGAKERLTRGLGYVVYSTALVSREIFPGGTTGSYGHNIPHQAGSHEWSSSGPNGIYNNMQQARWVAEEALRRFEELGNVSAEMRYEASLTAGYANRVLGENWCEAVFDGGPLEPGIEYFERAEEHFTNALALAETPEQRHKALAGRAQVRVWLEDWAGAAADAALVPTEFVYQQEMDFTSGTAAQRNHIYFAGSSSPYRSYTTKFTTQHENFVEFGDPRTAWRRYPADNDTLCVGSLQGYPGGRVPCTQQQKYLSENDDINLASGREMRLIEAEAALSLNGAAGIATAINLINGIRTSVESVTTGQPLPAYSTSVSLEEAWTILKRERGIELWLEGRRMGDQRRWDENNVPGSYELPNFEARSPLFTEYPRGREVNEGVLQPRVLCYNISNDERNTNPNIPDAS